MEHKRKSLLRFGALGMLLLCGITVANAQTPQEIAKKALAATVLLAVEDVKGEFLGLGSGFFVKPNLIATNFHVVEGAASVIAKRVEQKTAYSIESVAAKDKKNDLAILRVSAPGVKPLPLGDSEKAGIGDTVYVMGNPKGFEGTFSVGNISSIREVGIDKLPDQLIQLTAPISQGSSGGPVLNEKGEVIGVSMGGIPEAQNLNFAIPSNYLKALIAQLEPTKPLPKKQPPLRKEKPPLPKEQPPSPSNHHRPKSNPRRPKRNHRYLRRPTSLRVRRRLPRMTIRVPLPTMMPLSVSNQIMPMPTSIGGMRRRN